MVVAEVMTKDPAFAAPTWTVNRVLRVLFENDFRHLPVVHKGELIGMVSDRDLKEQVLVPAMVSVENPGEAASLLDQPISDVMSGGVISVYPESELAEVIDLMLEHGVGAVPVIETGTSRLAGIISYVDILRVARDSI